MGCLSWFGDAWASPTLCTWGIPLIVILLQCSFVIVEQIGFMDQGQSFPERADDANDGWVVLWNIEFGLNIDEFGSTAGYYEG